MEQENSAIVSPNTNIEITWLGHATCLIKSGEGKLILIDPWLRNNPAVPENMKTFAHLDIMLITHGHFDHIGDAVEVAKLHKPQVVCVFETGEWLKSKGVENVVDMNKGGTVDLGDIKITMVHADHSCGISDDDKIVYGGDPCGYVITLENGYRIYHAGDTNVFGDMALIRDLYAPDLACLPIGDHYVMSPREAALAVKLLGVKRILPIHWGTFPILRGNPQQLREILNDPTVEIIDIPRGGTLNLI